MSFPPSGKKPAASRQAEVKQRRLAWQKDDYDSEEEDAPPDEYHWLLRQHDRARIADPAERAARRRMAVSRPQMRDADGNILPIKASDFISQDAHRFRQDQGHCMANCAVFFQLRQLGYSVKETLKLLDHPCLKPGIDAIQYKAECVNAYAGTMTPAFEGARFLVADTLLHAPAGGRKHLPGIEKAPLVYGKLIGGIAEATQEKDRLTKRTLQYSGHAAGNRLEVYTGGLDAKPRNTLQASLFQGYRNAGSEHLELAGSKGFCGLFGSPPKKLVREALPFVLLALHHYAPVAADSHLCLLDLSTPGLPGLFDPNYGWLSVEHHCDFLHLENILFACWTEYEKGTFKIDPEHVGLRHVQLLGKTSMSCMAYQLYRQILA